MSDKDPKDPSTTSHAYDAMLPRWEMISNLLAGTEAMRAAGERYLPRHMEESDLGYDERLNTAVLLNMTELTLDALVGRPFREPIKIGDDVPEKIVDLMGDIDLQGNKLDVFAFDWFRDGVAKGFNHILVDFPRVQNEGNRTLADDRVDNLRPYWVHVPPENVIFSASTRVNGVEVLTHVRIREKVTVQVGFAEVEIDQIRVLEPGVVFIYQKTRPRGQKEEWRVVDAYETSLDFIPLVTFYADREELMFAKPPLLDLATLNVRWWQSNSDQQSVLTVARFPIFAASGVEQDTGIIRIGPRQVISTEDPAAKYYYVEHSGRAIESGRFELSDLEDRMSNYGAQMLRRKPGNSTATARSIDSAESISQLQRMTCTFIDAMKTALDYTAAWMGLADGGTVDMNRDFSGLNDKDPTELDVLFKTRQLRDMSREAYLEEMKRRGIVDEAYDIEADAVLLQEELAELDAMSDPEEGDTPSEDARQA